MFLYKKERYCSGVVYVETNVLCVFLFCSLVSKFNHTSTVGDIRRFICAYPFIIVYCIQFSDERQFRHLRVGLKNLECCVLLHGAFVTNCLSCDETVLAGFPSITSVPAQCKNEHFKFYFHLPRQVHLLRQTKINIYLQSNPVNIDTQGTIENTVKVRK